MKKNIFDKIDDMKTEHAAKLAELTAQRDQCEKEQQQKEIKAAEILKTGTPEQYAKARAAAAESAYTLEFYQKRIDELETAPVYGDPDKLIKDIKEYIDKETAAIHAQEDAALNEARDQAEARREMLVKANEYAQTVKGCDIYGIELTRAVSRVRTLTGEIQAEEITKSF